MKNILDVLLIACFIAVFPGCSGGEDAWEKTALDRAVYQTRVLADKFAGDTVSPRTFSNGEIKVAPPADWTSGFFPGSLWLLYDLTGDGYFKTRAMEYTHNLYNARNCRGTHDLGFMIYCSYGNQYRFLKDTLTASVIVDASDNLISRVDPAIGLIRSWDFGWWNYPVIIDNMMNLEMLFWASKYTGDTKYADAAIRHADLTMKNHFREDCSSYHVVSYNDDGTVQWRGTFQGQADTSSWARGQAWGLYGYTMCYRETGFDRYLEHARHIAEYIMENNPGYIPYWDYDAPDIPYAPRDASAAAVAASAFLELSSLTGDRQYFDYAVNILKVLSSDEYLAEKDENGWFTVKHCVGHLPAKAEIDVPLNYCDYYFLEAIKRYKEIGKRNFNE